MAPLRSCLGDGLRDDLVETAGGTRLLPEVDEDDDDEVEDPNAANI
jgi:hypothetical protein